VEASRLQALGDPEWEALLGLSRRLDVAPLLYQRLQAGGADTATPPAVGRVLRECYLATAASNLRFYRELQALLGALRAAGVRVMVLKGAFLAEVVYRNVALRPLGDLDLLVPVEELDKAVECLRARGYHCLRPFDVEVHARVRDQLPGFFRTGAAAMVDLHYGVAAPRPGHAVDVQGLWERCVPARVAGTEVLSLCPEDLLLHLCGHLAYQHEFAFGLRPLCDIAATVEHYGADLRWEALIARAGEWRWQRGVYLALLCARDLVGAPVPSEVLEAMRPAGPDADLRQAARALIVQGPPLEGAGIPATRFAHMWQQTGLGGRLRLALHYVLVSKESLAGQYGVPARSPRIYFCYGLRLRDLLANNVPIAAGLIRRRPETTRLLRSKDALRKWLTE
jgi:hypothetical protein